MLMKDFDFTITARYLFCGVPPQGPEDAEYSSGDLIECLECGEGNDFDSVVAVAAEKGIEEVKNTVDGELAESPKGLFRGKP